MSELHVNTMSDADLIGISGVGVLSARGLGVAQHKQAFLDATALESTEISGFKASNHIKRRYLRPLDQVTVQCIAMVADAMADAGIAIDSLDQSRVGVVIGSMYAGIGCIFDFKQACYEAREEEYLGLSPLFFPGIVFNSLSGQPAIEFGFTGVNSVVNSGNASGLLAVIKGAEYIRSGQADIVIAGGAEMRHPLLDEKYSVRGADPRLADLGENFKFSEAVCLYVLHRANDQRFAENKRYATLGNSSYGYLGQGFGDGLFTKKLAKQLSVNSDLPDTVIACTENSAPLNEHESTAIETVFADQPPRVMANKSIFGHTLGASGSLNLLHGLTMPESKRVQVNSLDPDGNFALLTITREAHRD